MEKYSIKNFQHRNSAYLYNFSKKNHYKLENSDQLSTNALSTFRNISLIIEFSIKIRTNF